MGQPPLSKERMRPSLLLAVLAVLLVLAAVAEGKGHKASHHKGASGKHKVKQMKKATAGSKPASFNMEEEMQGMKKVKPVRVPWPGEVRARGTVRELLLLR